MVINNLKYSALTVAPNHKEIDYWIDLTEDPNGGIIKYYNGTKWDYLNQMDDLNGLILEIKESVDEIKDALDSITVEKVNDLQYNIKVGDKVAGSITIPKDQFLESVNYDEDTYMLILTFLTTEGLNIQQISLRNLLDNTDTTYTFEDGTDGSFTVTEDGSIPQKVNIGKPATAGTADVALEVEWDNVESKPSTFTPSAHTHTVADITDMPTTTVADFNAVVSALTLRDPEQEYITVQFTTQNTVTGATNTSGGGSTIYAADATQMGYMTSTMFNKLQGIENNANNYVLPTATTSATGGVLQAAQVSDTIVDGTETATTVATTLNNLLAALRTAGIIAA